MNGTLTRLRLPGRSALVLRILAGVGACCAAAGILFVPERGWQILLVNTLFWTGLAQGGVVFSAVYRITNAQWSRTFRTVAEGMVAFLPAHVVLLCILFAGGTWIYPWFTSPVPGKEVWLLPAFVVARELGVAGILLVLSMMYVAASTVGEVRVRDAWRRLLSGLNEPPASRPEAVEARLSVLVPLLLVANGLLLSLAGFDLVMSIDPLWVSTLFGWLFALHAFYGGIVVAVLLSVIALAWLGGKGTASTGQLRDMANLALGISLLAGGFAWSQYLVIWYGNIPEETTYLVVRFKTDPWQALTWCSIVGAYFLGLLAFMLRWVKERPLMIMAVTAVMIIALFLERFVMVIPWTWHGGAVPFGFLEIIVTLGFAAAFFLAWFSVVSRVPLADDRPQH